MKKNISSIFKKFLIFIAVWTYFILEAVIWDLILSEIYNKLKALKIMKKFEEFIISSNEYIVFIIFSSTFIVGEGLGIYATGLLALGHLLLFLALEALKIPIAFIAFFILKIAKDKLDKFWLFRTGYGIVMYLINKLKETDTWKEAVKKMKRIKEKVREEIIPIWREFRKDLKGNTFKLAKRYYRKIRIVWKRRKRK